MALRSWLVCLVMLSASRTAQAGLIINGSFENPTVPAGGFINYSAGSTAITGWTVVGVDSALVSGTFSQSGILFQAQEGRQWLDLAGVTSNSMLSGVRQNIATTIGAAYELDFYVGSAAAGGLFFPATVDLSIDGGARVSYTNPTGPSNMLNWRLFSVEFTATSSTTSFTFFNGSAPNNFLGALDNVSLNSVSAVPEPASITLVGTGMAILVIGASRRRRKSTPDEASGDMPS